MFCCKGKRLANYLIENGSTIVRIETDRNNSEYLVFLFESDETIRTNLEKWKNDRNTYRYANPEQSKKADSKEVSETKTEEKE